ncbi:MAG TPA: gamma-glutamylcyclotransferase family protein [Thermodesulfobacteriota bacterium]|nr:gamma-glutamylcyclotransferase family protein [Thermodesulfobacteriota bacterium]
MASITRNKDYIFVYGTLRKDSKNQMYHILARYADFVGVGTFMGKLYNIGEYPGTVPSDNPDDVVRGEVYALRDPNRVLKVLDDYEGCGQDDPSPTEFRRQKVNISLESGRNINAWIYIYNRSTDGLKVIPSGDYTQFIELKQ